MSWIKEEDMKAIRQQADIVDVMSQYLTLTKKGKNYTAVCPFHDDHDPSLSISTDKQIFKCFVCGTGGNVFTFVQKMEEISFPEAVFKVAQLINYPLERPSRSFEVKEDVNQPLYDVMNSFIQFTQYELNSESGVHAMEYLRQRKMNEDIIKRFQIGYAPASKNTMRYFQAKAFDREVLKEAGLIQNYDNEDFSIFHDRLMIPIHDEFGHPLAFTARTLSSNKQESKYINTGQTKIYEKGNVIFNYHRAKEFARKKHRCILVEGAMDVLAFEKADIHESIACLGTACTKQQMNLIKRLRVPVTVCYDGDRAGKDAAYKFGKLALEHQVDFVIVKNITGQDPDEIYNEKGKEELASFVEKTISFVEFLFDYLMVKYNLDNYEDKKQYAQELAQVIDKMCDDFEKTSYYTRIKTLTGFDFSARQENRSPKQKEQRQRPVFLKAPDSGRIKAEKAVLSMILVSKEAATRFKEEIGFFQDLSCNQLSLYCFDAYRTKNRLDFDELIVKIQEEPVRNLLVDLTTDSTLLHEYSEEYFQDSLLKIKECTLQEQIDLINRKIENVANPLEKVKMAAQKKELIIKKNALRKKEG